MRTKRLFSTVSSVAAILTTACAMSCAGDDVLELPFFDGGLDASITYSDAAPDTSSPNDAATDAPIADAADSSTAIDSGTDSGIHVTIDSGSDSGSLDAGTDAGLDAGADAGDDSGLENDAGDGGQDGGLVVNGCTTFEDDSDPAATRVIQGPPTSAPVQFTPNCMRISAGQSVTFQQANFSNHPLIPANGTTPSPINFTSGGTTVTFTFPTAGTYGFECQIHPSMMFGAIEVTP